DFLGSEQRREHDSLIGALEGDRYKRLVSDWTAFLTRPMTSSPEPRNARRRLAEVISARAWRLSRRIDGNIGGIQDDTTPATLHDLRIDAKKLRYLIDVTSNFYDQADIASILRALKTLQGVLGEFNDACVQEKHCLDYARASSALGGSPRLLFALGRLAEQ